MIQPSMPRRSVGQASISADVDVWRPRPVTALTTPTSRCAVGISAFTSVDLPTPLCPIRTLVRPRSRSRSSLRSPPRWVTTQGTPSGR